MRRREMILYPHGPAAPGCMDLCTRLTMAIGGDLSRVHDGPFPSLRRFIEHALRLRVIRDGTERPILVLTQTNPLGLKVIQARRDIEIAVPCLRDATWAVFVDPERDPFFFGATKALGHLIGETSHAPIWQTPHGGEFLVLSAAIVDTRYLAARMGA